MSPSKLALSCICSVVAFVATALPCAAGPMKHPGIWHTDAELQRVRANVAAGKEPWKSAWDAIKDRDANPGYRAKVSEEITDGYAMQRDGHAAYVLAVKWVASGDERYAKASMQIIDDWATVVKSAAKEPLRNGVGGAQMANAAEILAHAFDGAAGWPKANADRARTFFHDVIYPRVKNGASANWGTSAMTGLISMGVFCDDQEMFDRGVAAYKNGFVVNGSIKGGCCGVTQYIDATGENAESGRDQPHSQGGIGHLVEVALVAWNQGVDIVSYNDDFGVRDYGATGDNRLVVGLEYTAKYNLGNDVPYHPFFEYCNNVTKYPTGPSDKGRGNFSPIWEMTHHLFTIAKKDAPFSRGVTEHPGYAPEATNSDHPGLGTLLYRAER